MIDVPVEVKEILQDGRQPKNFRFNVLNDDGTVDFVISNSTLVSETVNFDERMCSGDTIKFGLCEGTSLEFQYFDHPNIKGRQIQCFIDIKYGDNQTCSIPMGYFTVEKCSRQASTGIIKVTAYNKLQSDYLDQKANLVLANTFTQDFTLTYFDIEQALLGHYQIAVPKIGAAISSLSPSGYSYRFEGITLTKGYGCNSPINWCELSNAGLSSIDTPFALGISSLKTSFTIQTPFTLYPRRPDAAYGLLLDLEQILVNHVKNIIDKAELSITGDEFIDMICDRPGFNTFLGVKNGLTSQMYSTVQWEYEERMGIAHTVAGPLQDIQRLSTTITSYDCYYPVELYVATATGSYYMKFDGKFRILTYDRDYYDYYSDPEMTETVRVPYEAMKFSDGTDYATNNPVPVGIYSYQDLTQFDQLTSKISEMPDFTLRDLVSANYEVVCQFGKLDRITDLFSGVELNRSNLFPADTLYPDNELYPGGAALSSHKSMYSKLWGDEGNIQKWRYLIITYKTLVNNQEQDVTLQRTVNADGTCDYNMSDNWIFRNRTWTAAQIGTYADAMVAKMRDMTWFPFEMWCAGLPYLETGDEIEVSIGNKTYSTYILQRQLKGIQNLQDTYINGTLDIF